MDEEAIKQLKHFGIQITIISVLVLAGYFGAMFVVWLTKG